MGEYAPGFSGTSMLIGLLLYFLQMVVMFGPAMAGLVWCLANMRISFPVLFVGLSSSTAITYLFVAFS